MSQTTQPARTPFNAMQRVLRRLTRRISVPLFNGYPAVAVWLLRALLTMPLLQKLVGFDSEQSRVRETLGQILARLGRPEEAIAVYREILAVTPHNGSMNAFLGLANCLSQAGDRRGALDTLQQLLDFDPTNVQALVTKGQIQAVEGAYDNSIETFIAALQIDPRSTDAKAGLLNVLPVGTASAKSVEHLQMLLAIEPGDHQAWRVLGRMMLENETIPVETPSHAVGDVKPFNRDRPWEAYRPTKLLDQLSQEHDSYTAQLGWFQARITELRSANTEWAKLVVIQESRLGFLDSYHACGMYSHTQQYMRNLALFRERFGEQSSYPAAPAEIPAELLPGFTMNGRIPVEHAYLNAVYSDRYADIISDHDINGFSQMIVQQLGGHATTSFFTVSSRTLVSQQGQASLGPQALQAYSSIYGQTDVWLVNALEKERIEGFKVAVYGSINPLHETLCLMAGAKPTTIRRRPIVNRTSRLTTMTVAEWEAHPVSFDSALAISCLEHEGLGMFGEPLDPDADLKAMRRLKRIVKPGGLLFVAVPVGLDRVMFNSTRIYGGIRLPMLFDCWTMIAQYGYEDELLESNGEVQPLFVLKNE